MPDANPLGIYEPFSTEQVKALTEISHPRYGNWYGAPSYSSWGSWDAARTGAADDYARLVGDLSLSSLAMSGVRWLGNVLPSAPLMVMDAKGEKDQPVEVKGHALPKLWRRPNRFYSGSTLCKGIAYSWILSGNAYVIKVWNKTGTKVVELWWEPHTSIRPRWMNDSQGAYIPFQGTKKQGEPDPDDPRAFINYYELDREGQKYRIEVSDVIHFRDGFDPANRRLGLSRVEAIRREVYGDAAASEFAASLAGGSGVPSFVLEIDKELTMTQDEVTGLEQTLVRKTSGPKKGQPIVVIGGKVHKLGTDPDKMDLRSSHRFAEERYSAVTGIPAVALELGAGHEHSIYNNVKQADERAYEAYLLPLYSHFEDELNVQLLEDFDGEGTERFCKFDTSNIRALEEDKDALHKRAALDYRTGGIDRAEYRKRIGEKARPEDEGVYFPNTGAKGPKEGEVQDAQNRPQNAQNGEEDAETDRARLRLIKAVLSAKAVPPDEEVEATVDWFDAHAPKEAVGILAARVVNNGNGAGKR